MKPGERLDQILASSAFTDEERATVAFALGLVATLPHNMLAWAEKKTDTPYQKIARALMDKEDWGRHVMNPGN